jgi:hypothetical protein
MWEKEKTAEKYSKSGFIKGYEKGKLNQHNKYFVIGDEEKIFIFKTEKLIQFFKGGVGYRKIIGETSKGIIVNYEYIIKNNIAEAVLLNEKRCEACGC